MPHLPMPRPLRAAIGACRDLAGSVRDLARLMRELRALPAAIHADREALAAERRRQDALRRAHDEEYIPALRRAVERSLRRDTGLPFARVRLIEPERGDYGPHTLH